MCKVAHALTRDTCSVQLEDHGAHAYYLDNNRSNVFKPEETLVVEAGGFCKEEPERYNERLDPSRYNLTPTLTLTLTPTLTSDYEIDRDRPRAHAAPCHVRFIELDILEFAMAVRRDRG